MPRTREMLHNGPAGADSQVEVHVLRFHVAANPPEGYGHTGYGYKVPGTSQLKASRLTEIDEQVPTLATYLRSVSK